MNNKLKQLLLRIKLSLGAALVNQFFAIDAIFDLLLLHHILNVGQVFGVTSHVSGKNDSNESLAERFEIISREVLQKVILRLV